MPAADNNSPAAAPPPAPNTEIMFCGECRRARKHSYVRLELREHMPDLKLVKGQRIAFWKCETCGYSSELPGGLRLKC